MNKHLFVSLIIVLLFASCTKSNSPTNAIDFNTLTTTVLTDFTHNVAIENYKQLDNAATDLNNAINQLNVTATTANLEAAKTAWKNMRSFWEQSEGFLFGPVEDKDYDPQMDSWPSDYVQLDSLLNSSNALTVADIQNLTLTLRGYHPIEYILFGNHGSRVADSITARQKNYMVSLAIDLKNTCHDLYLSWTAAPTLFSQEVIKAGRGSTVYAKKQEAYLAIVGALIAICDEVGGGKMKEPFDAKDPQIVESPYSGNSIADFRNNIKGIQNVYLGKFGSNDGSGINDIVATKNIALDNKIQNQITAAINSFNNITNYFEFAIINQRIQCQQTMDALAALKATLEDELKPFIIINIKD